MQININYINNTLCINQKFWISFTKKRLDYFLNKSSPSLGFIVFKAKI